MILQIKLIFLSTYFDFSRTPNKHTLNVKLIFHATHSTRLKPDKFSAYLYSMFSFDITT